MADRGRRPSRTRMALQEVRGLVEAERRDSLSSFQSSDLQDDRARALDYYMGDMSEDMPHLKDRSSAVSRDVMDTVEGMLPFLMDVFLSGDNLVRFKPVGPEDIEPAKQESAFVNHCFLHKNPGYMVLHTMFKDALLSKTGIVKVWWGKDVHEEQDTYEGLTEDGFAALMQDESLELVSYSEREVPSAFLSEEAPGELGAESLASPAPETPEEAVGGGNGVAPAGPPPVFIDAVVRRREEVERLMLAPVPPEEYGISRRAKSVRDATYQFHETWITASDLKEQGYDPKQVDELSAGEWDDDKERLARDTVSESDNRNRDVLNFESRGIKVTEHYVRMDYEGEGRARLYKVTTAGDTAGVVLRKKQPNGKYKADIELVDRAPFAVCTPIPITHRFFGLSIADVVADIQRIKTGLLRIVIDNAFLANNQRLEVAEEGATANTIDDILANRIGGIVRTKRVGSIAPIPNQPITGDILPLMAKMDEVRTWRTGMTPQGQGIDPDALQNQRMEAVSKLYNAAQARIKQIAKIFAEGGVRDLISLMHETIRKNDTKGDLVEMRGRWIQVDPQVWRRRDDMTIKTGLGTGTREQHIQLLFALLNQQKEAVAEPASRLAEPQHLYNTLTEIVESSGLGDVRMFFSDPGPGPIEDGGPSPEEMKIQADIQIKQQELQAKMAEIQAEIQMKQMDGQLKQQESSSRLDLERIQADADIATQDRKTAAEIALAERRFELEREMKVLEAQLKMAASGMDLENKFLESIKNRDDDVESAIIDAMKATISELNARVESKEIKKGRKTNGEVSSEREQQLLDMMDKLMKTVTRKRTIIRDPQTNRAIGIE